MSLYSKIKTWLNNKAISIGGIAQLSELAKAHKATLYKVLSYDKQTKR